MHEVSICQSILKTIEEEFEKEQLENVYEIHLKAGLLSCVQPQFLEHVFKYMIADSPLKNSMLHIERTDIIAECEICRHTFKVEKYVFVCPQCGSPTSKIIEGNELLIHKILLKEPVYEKAD